MFGNAEHHNRGSGKDETAWQRIDKMPRVEIGLKKREIQRIKK